MNGFKKLKLKGDNRDEWDLEPGKETRKRMSKLIKRESGEMLDN